MKANGFFVFFVLYLMLETYQKRADAANPYYAFKYDINACLFSDWVKDGVLDLEVKSCKDNGEYGLCYGKHSAGKALFAVCYNEKTLIAKFTGHILQPLGTQGEAGMIQVSQHDDDWKKDGLLEQSGIAVARKQDYKHDLLSQGNKFDNYKQYSQFLAKGHLTPSGDFSKINFEQSFTTILTNAAPQWQPFNDGNWKVIEDILREYARDTGHTLYVFTGTGGEAVYNKLPIMLNNKVLTPKYFWKAVCDPDPAVKQSIVFIAENSVGVVETKDPLVDKDLGCIGIKQTKMRGIVQCESLKEVKLISDYADFKLPPFSEKNCNPNKEGDFLDGYLKLKLW